MWTHFIRSNANIWFSLIGILVTHFRLLGQPLPPQWDRLSLADGLSQSYVTCMIQDRLGFMWFGTAEGLNRYDGLQFKSWFHQANNPNSISNNLIDALLEDQHGHIWLGTEDGLTCYLPEQDTFVRYYHQPNNLNSLSHNKVWALLEDRQGFIWIGTTNGLNRFDPVRKRFTRYPFQEHNPNGISSPKIRSLYQDRQGLIWIGTYGGGLNVLNPGTNQFTVYRHEATNPQSLSHDIVTNMYEDRQGRFWVATYGGGLNLMDRRKGAFKAFRNQAGNPNSLSHDAVYTLLEDKQGQFWVGTDGGGLNLMDRSKEVFTRYLPMPTDRHSLSSPVIKTIFQDRQQNLWLGTWQGGINIRYAARQPFRVYKSDRYASAGMRTELITAFLEDEAGHIWIDVDGNSLSRFDPKTNQFTYYPNVSGLKQYPFTNILDPQGKLWQLTRTSPWRHWLDDKTGLIKSCQPTSNDLLNQQIDKVLKDWQNNWWMVGQRGVVRFDYRQRCYQTFRHEPANPYSLAKGNISTIFEDQQHRVWLGVANGIDLFDSVTHRFSHYPFDRTGQYGGAIGITQDNRGLIWVTSGDGELFRLDPNQGQQAKLTHSTSLGQSAMGVLTDAQNRIWITTRKGLLCYDTRQSSLNQYDHRDGLQSDEFLIGSLLKARNGLFYVGGISGFNVFDPLQIQKNPYRPPVVLTDFQLANQAVPIRNSAGDTLPEKSPLPMAVPYVNQLELAHNQNDFSFGFAALNYYLPQKNRFRFRLNGYDTHWRETNSTQPVASYTNIDPGNYSFEVQAANNDGLWNKQSLLLPILIHRPWWASYWAYGLYGLLVVGLSLLAIRRYRRRLTQKQLAQQQAYEDEQGRVMTALKSHFFDNITHEFRTPLTLILTPTQQLKEKLYDPTQEAQNHRRLDTIDRSAHQLLSLVNQLLDLSKLEAKALPVEESTGDLVLFVQTIVDSFRTQAEVRSIQLNFDSAGMQPAYWFDSTKLERILVNLLANALKFTNAGGTVLTQLTPLDDGVQITVSDTGIGIAPEELPRIFERFYRVTNVRPDKLSKDRQREGSGIGLALVYELVQLQKGKIEVQSQEREGTTFQVTLPYRPVAAALSATTAVDPAPLHKATEETPVVLVVEDNAELRQLIAESLPAHYRVLQALNGQVGFEQAVEQIPDLIISDVLMPVMDGYTLVRHLKNDWRTSHIPVLLLTAKTAPASRLTGLSLGADDYLTKPFQIEELQWRVHNRLQQAQQLRNWFKASLTQPDQETSIPGSAPIDPFLESVYALVEQHLDDSTFGAEALAATLEQSRMSVYRKLKALTGLSASECIRGYRLKRACVYLQQGMSVTETAYQVGFESPAYFTKCFRETYQLTPTEFARSNTPLS